MDQKLNLNVDSKTVGDCVKTVSNIGSTVYHNICNGSTSIVHWGSADWIGNIAILLMAVTFFSLLGLMFYKASHNTF